MQLTNKYSRYYMLNKKMHASITSSLLCIVEKYINMHTLTHLHLYIICIKRRQIQ